MKNLLLPALLFVIAPAFANLLNQVPMVVRTGFTETFTIGFESVIDDDAVLELRWEKTKATMNIHADSQEKALENIKKAIADPAVDYRAYASSAR
ncbi:MAG: hypothetical protein IPI91_19625 [Flavobacteriales bacterium]|nr:hypothetical protein [Flavobacteriales bacterium]